MHKQTPDSNESPEEATAAKEAVEIIIGKDGKKRKPHNPAGPSGPVGKQTSGVTPVTLNAACLRVSPLPNRTACSAGRQAADGSLDRHAFSPRGAVGPHWVLLRIYAPPEQPAPALLSAGAGARFAQSRIACPKTQDDQFNRAACDANWTLRQDPS